MSFESKDKEPSPSINVRVNRVLHKTSELTTIFCAGGTIGSFVYGNNLSGAACITAMVFAKKAYDSSKIYGEKWDQKHFNRFL